MSMDTWTHGHMDTWTPKKTGGARVWEDKKRLKIFVALFFLAILNVSGEHLEAWTHGHMDTQKKSAGPGPETRRKFYEKKTFFRFSKTER